MTWSVYILQCTDDSLYTGIAKDVKKRFSEHCEGKGSRYVRAKGAKRIVYQSVIGSHSAALKEERRIKKLTRSQKQEIIRGSSVATD